VTMIEPHFEANQLNDLYLYPALDLRVYGGTINSGARQVYFDQNSPRNVSFDKTRFSSSHASPILFSGGGIGTSRISFNQVRLPTNTTFGGSSYTGPPMKRFLDMPLTTYRFRQDNVLDNTDYNPMKTEGGTATGYTMAEKGHIMGVRVYYTGTMSSGTYYMVPMLNGSQIAEFLSPTEASNPAAYNTTPLSLPVVVGDKITFRIITGATTVVPGADFIAEIIVAHGESGVE
jgi:hypothetical protein